MSRTDSNPVPAVALTDGQISLQNGAGLPLRNIKCKSKLLCIAIKNKLIILVKLGVHTPGPCLEKSAQVPGSMDKGFHGNTVINWQPPMFLQG